MLIYLLFPFLLRCTWISQISLNNNWYTSPLLIISRRSIHSSLMVLSKWVFSVSDPKWCNFSLLKLHVNLSIRYLSLSTSYWFILKISYLRSLSLYFSRNILFLSFHDLIELVPKLMNSLRALSFNVARNNLNFWVFNR